MPLTAAQLTTLKADAAAALAAAKADATAANAAVTAAQAVVTEVGTLVADTVTPPPPPPPPPPPVHHRQGDESERVHRVVVRRLAHRAVARDGMASGYGPWNTGPLVNQPTSGSFPFEQLDPGSTYTYTLTYAGGKTLTVTLLQPPPVPPPPPPPTGAAGFGQPLMAAPVGTLGQYTAAQLILHDVFLGPGLDITKWSTNFGGSTWLGSDLGALPAGYRRRRRAGTAGRPDPKACRPQGAGWPVGRAQRSLVGLCERRGGARRAGLDQEPSLGLERL